jgi:Ca2+/Na+ antiporter
VAEFIANLLKAISLIIILLSRKSQHTEKEPVRKRTPFGIVGYLVPVTIMFFDEVYVILGLIIFFIGIYLVNLALLNMMSGETSQQDS